VYPTLSDHSRHHLEGDVKAMIDNHYQECKSTLSKLRPVLESMTHQLLKKKVMFHDDLVESFNTLLGMKKE
jgi:ATP-dependent Zn protease